MNGRHLGLSVPNASLRHRGSRWLLALLTGISFTIGFWIFYRTVSVAGLNLAEYALLPLFSILFTWIAFSFWTATFGLVVTLWGNSREPKARTEHAADKPLSRTAVLMPVHNEAPSSVFAGVRAMIQSLTETGNGDKFDFFVLSDTTDPDIWLEEERAWARCATEPAGPRLFYRRRPHNSSRKAGNIADFCNRWGSQYAYMVVLDADSLMEGQTLVEMVRRMDADPKMGILQVPPTPVNRMSFFARLQQFAARIYGPIYIQGFVSWAQFDSNYWGHNAIIRVEPFIKHCGLPTLPGKAPLGGEILSHDFVEAALMARAGWKVCLAEDLGGSYEECPTTLIDFAKRDERWCQGNMQHIRLVFSEGFRPLSRVHMAMGAMSYLASPLWLLFMILSALAMLIDGDTVTAEEQWVRGGAVIFSLTMALLLLPKVWGLIALQKQPERIEDHGGWRNVVTSVALETAISTLIAPLMMVFHTRFVLTTLLLGKKVQWTAQNRGEGTTDLAAAFRIYWPHTLLGVGTAWVVWAAAPQLLLWFSPIIAGLVLSIPLSMLLGDVRLGQRLATNGLLLIPEERQVPAILQSQKEALEAWTRSASDLDRGRLFEAVLTDPSFHLLHRNLVRATDANVTANPDELRPILEKIKRDGPQAATRQDRLTLLSDADALRDLHVSLRSTVRYDYSAIST